MAQWQSVALSPAGPGFDRYFGHTAGHWGEYFDAPLEDDGRMVRTSGYIVDVCVERAEAFIREQQDRPFFVLSHLQLRIPRGRFRPRTGSDIVSVSCCSGGKSGSGKARRDEVCAGDDGASGPLRRSDSADSAAVWCAGQYDCAVLFGQRSEHGALERWHAWAEGDGG